MVITPPPQQIIHSLFTPHKDLDSKTYLTYRNIAIFALLTIFFLIFVFSPFAVYSSDVSQFDPSQTFQTLGGLFGFFLLFSFLGIYLTSFFYKTRLLKLGVYGVSVILCIGLIYTFVLDFNVITGEAYAQIDNFVFKNPHIIPNAYNKFVDLGVGILACVIMGIILLLGRAAYLALLKIIFAALIVVSAFHLYIICDKRLELARDLAQQVAQDSAPLPHFHHHLASFSKTQQNILILLFDGFSGSHLRYMFEQFPQWQKAFDGFVYYPNTLSLDGHTTRTAHTILTGHTLAPLAQRDKSLQEYSKTINQALLKSYEGFRAKGFDVISYGMPHIYAKDSQPNLTIIEHNSDYVPYYQASHNIAAMIQDLRTKNTPIGEMASIGLFYFAPYTLRTRIYKDFEFGNYSWIFGKKQQIGSFINGIELASYLPSIVRNLNTESKHKTFKYIHTMTTHYPFVLDSHTCEPAMQPQTQLPQELLAFLPNPNHYDNEICAIKETLILLEFLRKNNIYDNTMIVLVSDHSYNDLPSHNMPYKPSLGNNPNPLLLIKDFSNNAPLRYDERLMSNADVYGILCDATQACKEPSILKNYPTPRILTHTLNVHWTQEAKRANHLIFDKIWQITDNVLDVRHWQEIAQ